MHRDFMIQQGNNASFDVLTLKDVSNVYSERTYGLFGRRNEKKVLDSVNLRIAPGEIFGLVGESGSGKSTLANCVLGLVSHTGKILVNGIPRENYSRMDFAKIVRAVFQDPASSLNPARRVGWILNEPLAVHGLFDKPTRRTRIIELLDLVGLDESYADRFPRELSGGQKQRVCIAAALALNPSLLIADEAVSSLDVSVGAQILNLFSELNEKLGLAILFISHNLNVVYHMCDTIAVIKDGRLVETGGAQVVYSNPVHPYTKELLASAPQIAKR